MTRPPIDQTRWQPWIDHVCAAVGVDPRHVQVRLIHQVSGEVASYYERPMGPVSAHLLGLATGSAREAGAAEAIATAAREAGGRRH